MSCTPFYNLNEPKKMGKALKIKKNVGLRQIFFFCVNMTKKQTNITYPNLVWHSQT